MNTLSPFKTLGRLRCARGLAAGLLSAALLALLPAVGWAQSLSTFTTSTSSLSTTSTSTGVDLRTSTGTVRNIIEGGDQVNTIWHGRLPLGDRRVQSALDVALASLRAQLPPFPKGATLRLLSRTPGSGGTSSTSTQNLGSTLSSQAEFAIGPDTIIIGDRDTGGTPFVVIAGSTNVNINTLTETRINQITTLTGGAPTVETLLQQRFFTLDLGAVFSLLQSGLPVALLQREVLLSLENVATRDINGRLFRLRAESSPQPGGVASLGAAGDGRGVAGPTGKESKSHELRPPGWEVFGSGNFGFADQEQSAAQVGFGSNTWAGTVGVERRVAPGFTLGLAGTYLQNRTDLSQGLGRLDIEGFAVAAYASYVRSAFYADLLYSFGDYENEVRRNTLTGSTARATPHAQHHTVQFRTGWNFQAGPVVTGPIVAASYTHGALDGYTETGAGTEDTRVADQDYDSLTSELGWQVSQRVPVRFGAVTWQLRASWQHQYLDESESVAVGLVDSPLYSVSGSGSLSRTGRLTLNGETAAPDRDSLTVGGGLLFEVGERTRVLLDYAGNFTGGDRSEQVVAARVSVSF